MNRKIVAKFGGTSVKTAEAIRSVTHIVMNQPNIRVVVVSAVGGVTNLLVELCHSKDKPTRLALIQKITDIHMELMHALHLDLASQITTLIQRLDALHQTERMQSDAVDHVLSLGEDLSSLMIHAFFHSEGIRSTLLDARQYLITDGHFGKATPHLDSIQKFIFPEELCVTQGFIGATHDGRTTTLGRGGSDYSAALIAEALHADELLIFTDVPGVYTTDPNLVPEASLIEKLSFYEMAEMANFGAKIVHPATLEPCVRNTKIPIRILSTFEPEAPGTLIQVQDEHSSLTPLIRAITLRKGQVLVTIKSSNMLNAHGFLATIFSILAKHKISIDLITTSEVSVALTLDGAFEGSLPFVHNPRVLEELQEFAEVTVEEHLSLIAVVGSGLTIPGIIQKTLKILEPFTVRMVCYGASHSSISILVPKKNAHEMVRLLHQHLLIAENTNSEIFA